jgi:Ca2+/Na+ antiporter
MLVRGKNFLYQFAASVLISGAILGIAALVYSRDASTVLSSANAVVPEMGAEEYVKPLDLAEEHPKCPHVCEEAYGFLPCSDSLGGSLILMIFYGGILLFAAQCIGDGGEGLLDLGIMSPSVIGGVLLPILGAVPDAVIILVSAMSGSVAAAEKKIAVGVGTLAGSTIMLLTIALSACLWSGRCDLDEDGKAKDGTLNGEVHEKGSTAVREYDNVCGQLTSTGLTHNAGVLKVKYFMLLTSLIYVLAQIPASMYGATAADTRSACGIVAGVAVVMLVFYLIINTCFGETEEFEEKKVAKRENRLLMVSEEFKGRFGTVSNMEVIDPVTGKANRATLAALFQVFDADGSGTLDEKEIERFTSICFLSSNTGKRAPQYVMDDLMKEASAPPPQPRSPRGCFGSAPVQKSEKDPSLLCVDKEKFIQRVGDLLEGELREATPDADAEEEKEGRTLSGALTSIILGTVLVTVFSDGVVDAINAFGNASGIPNFVIGFVVCPFASNASELFSSVQIASRKKAKNASVTFSQIYAACTMNNTLCLGVLLTAVHVRGLAWDFQAEVITIVAITWVIGASTLNNTTTSLWFAIVALLCYPAALVLVESLHAAGMA